MFGVTGGRQAGAGPSGGLSGVAGSVALRCTLEGSADGLVCGGHQGRVGRRIPYVGLAQWHGISPPARARTAMHVRAAARHAETTRRSPGPRLACLRRMPCVADALREATHARAALLVGVSKSELGGSGGRGGARWRQHS